LPVISLIMKLDLIILKDTFAICRFDSDSAIPEWSGKSQFYSVTRTRDEISIICRQADVYQDNESVIDKDWRILKIKGPLNLSLTGIIADISGILGKSKIPVFTISTYDTDYILVKKDYLDKAITSLKKGGYNILFEK
jgi:hypothetical protein